MEEWWPDAQLVKSILRCKWSTAKLLLRVLMFASWNYKSYFCTFTHSHTLNIRKEKRNYKYLGSSNVSSVFKGFALLLRSVLCTCYPVPSLGSVLWSTLQFSSQSLWYVVWDYSHTYVTWGWAQVSITIRGITSPSFFHPVISLVLSGCLRIPSLVFQPERWSFISPAVLHASCNWTFFWRQVVEE